MGDVASPKLRDQIKRNCCTHLRSQINALIFGPDLSYAELWGLKFADIDFTNHTALVTSKAGHTRPANIPLRLYQLIVR